jgi:predicted acylesterase/phospholipase RssA
MVDMLSPFRCQLAIQGGGAKFVALVAALEAIEELEKEGVIKVTRIAGTSAGAIAGTLFAARVPMAVVKASLEKINIRQLLPPVGKSRMLWRFVRGQPFWGTDNIRKELQNLLKHGKVSGVAVGDLAKPPGIPIYITATDLRNSGLRTCDDNEAIVNALLDSCALPLVFRAARNPVSNIVDGGICENLPSDLLTKHVSIDGPVLGLSFVPKASDTPKTTFEFCKALLATAINNSMMRAKRSLGDAVYDINTNIDTFDFDMTFSDSNRLRAEYENVRIKTGVSHLSRTEVTLAG